MKTFIGHNEARSTDEFIELALGTPLELWLGVEGESDLERAARQAAARDILAEDPDLIDRVSHLAADLLDMIPLHRQRPARRPANRTAVAA
ncbi:hypothetical protein ACEZCY_11120 [Streptacidiphilus sp. N1-12]|uniref:Uncharacterized protein n=2 Tax=Streptacidiphilus alkalitolerans TaxID=3342712 RepID=A0ABV6WCP5_9ACTN